MSREEREADNLGARRDTNIQFAKIGVRVVLVTRLQICNVFM
jgi:hypothetical protein